MLDISLLVATLFTLGIYLMLHKNLFSILFGISILSHAANVFILAMSGSPAGLHPPILNFSKESKALESFTQASMVDPLPQALILTAIVIGSGVLIYTIFFIFRIFRDHKCLDIQTLTEKEQHTESNTLSTSTQTSTD